MVFYIFILIIFGGIKNVVKKKNIDCDFCTQDSYVYTQSEDYIKKVEKEVVIAQSLGIKVSYETKIPIPFDIKAAVRFENQAQFHPLKYIVSLAKDIPGYLTSNTSKLFVATGFGKWGMTNSTAAAKIITDLIVKGDSPWAQVYNPSRFDIAASGAKLGAYNLEVAENLVG